MISDKIKWFSDTKGYGFIEVEDGDAPVRHSTISSEQVASISDPGQKALAELVVAAGAFSRSVWSAKSPSSAKGQAPKIAKQV